MSASYFDNENPGNSGAVATLIDALQNNTAGAFVDGIAYSASTASFPAAFIFAHSQSPGIPKAYLNWMVFDRNYNLEEAGYKPITSEALENGFGTGREILSKSNLLIHEPGYVYIYFKQ